jgi:tripartite-type tricarboxylate transporter receptor subunit TctC
MEPVVMLGDVPSVMLVPTDLPVNNLAEFIAYAKKARLSYGSGGIGSSPHLIGELLSQAAGIEMTHIPYRSTSQASTDLIPGRIQLLFDNLPSAISHIKAKTVRALLVAQDHRAESLPEIPTAGESGVPELLISPWFGVFAPANTSAEVLDELNAVFNAALKDPSVNRRVKELGLEVKGGSRQQLAKFVQDDIEKWGAIIRARKIVAE